MLNSRIELHPCTHWYCPYIRTKELKGTKYKPLSDVYTIEPPQNSPMMFPSLLYIINLCADIFKVTFVMTFVPIRKPNHLDFTGWLIVLSLFDSYNSVPALLSTQSDRQ